MPGVQIQKVEMEEGSKRIEFERANMTVIKHCKTNEVSNNSTIIHTDQCTSHEEESKVSSDGEKERNIVCQVDDPESSAKSKVENVYLLDNIGESERDRESLTPSEDKENRNSSIHVRTDHDGKYWQIVNVDLLSMLLIDKKQ